MTTGPTSDGSETGSCVLSVHPGSLGGQSFSAHELAWSVFVLNVRGSYQAPCKFHAPTVRHDGRRHIRVRSPTAERARVHALRESRKATKSFLDAPPSPHSESTSCWSCRRRSRFLAPSSPNAFVSTSRTSALTASIVPAGVLPFLKAGLSPSPVPSLVVCSAQQQSRHLNLAGIVDHGPVLQRAGDEELGRPVPRVEYA